MGLEEVTQGALITVLYPLYGVLLAAFMRSYLRGFFSLKLFLAQLFSLSMPVIYLCALLAVCCIHPLYLRLCTLRGRDHFA